MFTNKWLRVFIPFILIVIWFSVGAFGGPTFGKISDVATNDQASFLPSSAESTKVQKLQQKFDKGLSIPAIVLIESEEGIKPSELSQYAGLKSKFSNIEGIDKGIVGPIPSKDFKAIQFIVPVTNEAELKTVVADIRTATEKNIPENTKSYVTGPAGLSADLSEAFGGIDGILLAVALTAVFIILLFVYRSLLLPFLVLLNSVFALCAAIFVVYLLAKNGTIELNGQSQGILSILVIGAATDYSLLLVARYKEALKTTTSKWQAMKDGVKGSFEPILASAATVIIALLCLLFSDLNSNRSLGPIAATGILFSFLASLTFLPALLVAFGKVAFWPSAIKISTKKKSKIKTGHEELTGIWKKIGDIVAIHPRRVWVSIVVLLAVSALGLLQLQANGVSQTELVLSQSDAADGQRAIERHFNAGSGAPTTIAVPEKLVNKVVSYIKTNDNLSDITAYGGAGRTQNISEAKIIEGKILLSVTLKSNPYSENAESTIQELRTDLSKIHSDILVGGTTALALDTSTTARHDLFKIIPIVLVMIFIVLALLLRSIVAPLILIFTVVLSFGATLGISAIIFNNVFHFSGADASVPLFGFVFLVALGVDYNIFLMTRAREEAFKFGTRAAILHSLGRTGGVITSAGIVLAATFAALGIIPILFLAQIAFIVAFGVLLDTFIVRSLLVPALIYDIGAKSWWPSRKLTK